METISESKISLNYSKAFIDDIDIVYFISAMKLSRYTLKKNID
jgi:hypothetical protein